MGVYNGERFVAGAVESILAQTFRGFEVIVVDDGSTDDTAGILEGFDDARLRVLRQQNSGLSAALNRAIGESRGEYIARMDADDISCPARLERQVEFLDAHPDVGMVGTAYHEIDAYGKVLGTKVFPTDDADLRRTLIRFNPFFHGSVVLRRMVFDRVGPYRDGLSQDYDLWFRVASRFRVANLSAPLTMRRYDGANASIRRETEQIWQAVRARWGAIRRGEYSIWNLLHLVRPLTVLLLPSPIRLRVRRWLLGRRF